MLKSIEPEIVKMIMELLTENDLPVAMKATEILQTVLNKMEEVKGTPLEAAVPVAFKTLSRIYEIHQKFAKEAQTNDQNK